MRTSVLIVIAVGVFCGVGPLAQAPTDNLVVFVGARVIDGTGRAPIEAATLVVRNGRVEALGPSSGAKVPAGATRVDVSGKTIVPGLINTHGHVNPGAPGPAAAAGTRDRLTAQLRLYAQYGVTTVFSLGDDNEDSVTLRDEQERVALDRARLFVSGPVVIGATPDEARAAVNRVVAMNVDLIKIRVDDNLGTAMKMAPEVYRAIIEQAHKQGRRVAAHMFYLEDAKRLLDAGVDQLAHSVRDRDVDAAFVAEMKRRDVCLTPTLTREVSTFVYESTPEFFADPFFLRHADKAALAQYADPARQKEVRSSKAAQAYKTALKVASRNVKAIVDSGARVAMGTDTGPAGRFQGYFEHMELDLMVKAGLTPMQALVAATGDAARCMKVDGRLGALQPGAAADLLVLAANPLTDIRNLRTIESVWIAGRKIPNAP